MQTLLIIDMQNAWINEHPRYDIDAIFTRINRLAQTFREQAQSVIFIRHHDTQTPIGSSDWEVHAQLVHQDGDRFVDKTACDPFANTNLLEQLQTLGTSTVTICGLATEFCVDSAIRASLSAGFDVKVISDAHTTADRSHLSAKAIIDHHNWVWANLAVPLGRSIAVKTTDSLVAK